ncbi:hypothetical protein D3C81_1192390 [compost metagenome]
MHRGRVRTQGGHRARQAVGGIDLQRLRAGVFEVRQHRVIVIEDAVDRSQARHVFVDFADDAPHVRIERRQSLVLVRINRSGAGFRVPTGHPWQLRIEGKTQHRHPRKDFDVGPGAQLPGHAIEDVGGHRQVTVGEVQLVHQAIAGRVGEGLQEHRVGAHVGHALDQLAEVDFLLRGVRVVDVVEVHMHHAH